MFAHLVKYLSLLLLIVALVVVGIIAVTWYQARSMPFTPPPANLKTLSTSDLGGGNRGAAEK
jgi:hypothetical protein